MSRICKYPNGYEFTVIDKRDVLKCIDDNIIDKDVALAVVSFCEAQACKLVGERGMGSIPYFGRIETSKSDRDIMTSDKKDLLEEAKVVLDKERFVLFRNNLYNEVHQNIRSQKIFITTANILISRNRGLYNRMINITGISFAKVYFYSLYFINCVDNVIDNDVNENGEQ